MSWLLVGGECNRSPLIIFNTAVAERLKTKSQLRKKLWGRSNPPPLPHAEMEDEKTLDSDCICDLSPLNLHPAFSLRPADLHLYAILPPYCLFTLPPFTSGWIAHKCAFSISRLLQMMLKSSNTCNDSPTTPPPPPTPRNSSSQNISVPISYKMTLYNPTSLPTYWSFERFKNKKIAWSDVFRLN